jgi:hypothetical protein
MQRILFTLSWRYYGSNATLRKKDHQNTNAQTPPYNAASETELIGI